MLISKIHLGMDTYDSTKLTKLKMSL